MIYFLHLLTSFLNDDNVVSNRGKQQKVMSMLLNLFTSEKTRIRKNLLKCSSDYITHAGLLYMRDIFVEELQYNNFIVDKSLATKQYRFLRNSGASGSALIISQIYEQFPEIYNSVIDLYPILIQNIISITEEAEQLSTMLADTQRFHPKNPVFTQEQWMKELDSPKRRLDALLESYPREVTSIFQVFSGSHNMEYPSLGVVYHANFENYLMLIARRGDNQHRFITDMKKFMRTAEILSG